MINWLTDYELYLNLINSHRSLLSLYTREPYYNIGFRIKIESVL